MKRVIVSALPQTLKQTQLSESEAHHLIRVLRLKPGTRVVAVDRLGGQAECLLQVRGGLVWLELAAHSHDVGTPSETGLRPAPLALEIAVLKGEAMEWVVEKSVELGVERLFPFFSEHGVVKLGSKSSADFQARWQRIADQALKQCGRAVALQVAPPAIGIEALPALEAGGGELRFWADETLARREDGDRGRTLTSAVAEITEPAPRLRWTVGPEGGWHAREREWLAGREATLAVSLGSLTLRAETAALSGVAILAEWYRARR